MRRRRQRLQVSTFPFLAVLLCAMGSLILLLLVLDRRARAVARVRAEQAALSMVAEDEKLAAARQAEWERRRQALHALLTQQLEEARGDAGAIREKQENAAAEFKTAHAGLRDLESDIDAERGRLAHMENDLAARRASAAEDDKQTAATRADLERMARDLNSLEQALADLKTLRQRQQQTYSVVPYRGKHGDNRKPLYVECTAGCVLFHPDQQRLFVSQINPSEIHAEVDRRLAQRAAPADPETKPYLLLLVRPDGVLTYSRLQVVLRQFSLDYGYELIEQNWALAFPKDDQAPGSQPWMNTGPVVDKSETRPGIAARGNPRQPFRVLGGSTRNIGGGSGQAGQPGIGPGPEVPRGPAATDSGGFGGGLPNDPVEVLGRPKPGGGGAVGRVSGSGPGSAVPVQPALGRPVGIGSTSVGAPSSPPDNGAPGFADPPASGASLGFTPSPAGSPGEGVPGSSAQPGPELSAHAGAPDGGATPPVRPATVGAPQGARASGTAATGEIAGQQTANRGGTAGLLSNSPIAASEKPSGKPPQSEEQGPPGNEQTGGVSRLLAGPSEDKPVKPVRKTNDPPRRWISSRDWIIGVECVKGAVIVHPGDQRIAAADFWRSAGPDNPLQQAARKLIDRRQATVAPGEPPYRPQIRFLVRPDGLHSYYLAYPALEPLHVPMTRQNLEEEHASDQ